MIREHSRYRKYKQVLEEKLVSAELSIRFWAHHRNFWNWCIIAAPTQFSFHCTVVLPAPRHH